MLTGLETAFGVLQLLQIALESVYLSLRFI